jgi:lipopolysaccharide transport system permease protein
MLLYTETVSATRTGAAESVPVPPDGQLARAKDMWAPVVEIRGGRGRAGRESFVELWRYREVLSAFVVRYLKIRYKQAAIGVGWALLQPIAAAGIFAVFLGHFAKVGGEGAPYAVFALTGMAAWTYFSNAATSGSESLVYHEILLRKVYFPREILPIAAVSAALVDLVPAIATLSVLAAVFGLYPGVTWLALPLPILLLVTTAVAVSLALSAINVYYRDVRYALPFLIQLGFFATPVVYSLQTLPDGWREGYAVLNPLATVIDSFRRIVLHSEWPQLWLIAAALAWALGLAAGSYVLFKRLERGFADHV